MDNQQVNVNDYKLYSYRWVVLIVYAVNTALIQLMWATFFSVTTDAWKFYGFTDAAKGESAISLLSIIFMVGMIVLSIPSLAAFEKFGFKKAVGFGIVLMGICAIFRGLFGDSYTMVVIATVGFAVAQPFILNAPGLVAGKWFPEKERATANSVGLLASYFGMCVGLLATPLMLSEGIDIKKMLMIYGIAALVGAALFVILAKEKPLTPPCSEEEAVRSDFKVGIKSAMKKRNFVLSVVMFFCILGVFNTFFTLIEPILKDTSQGQITATQVGIVGVLVLIIGIIGSLVISVISDKEKRHRRLPFMIIANIVGTLGFALFLFASGFTGMVVAAAVYGFFVVGSAPVILTFAAEAAYPTSEGTSEGLLMFAGNVAGVVFLGGAALFGSNNKMLMAALVVVMIICVALMLIAKETKLEKRKD